MKIPVINEEQRKRVEDYSSKLQYLVDHFYTVKYIIQQFECFDSIIGSGAIDND